MVLPSFPPITCPDGREIPQTSQTDGRFPSDITKLCNEYFSTTIQAITGENTEAVTEKVTTNSTTFTIAIAAGISFLTFLIIFCIIFAIKKRRYITCDNIYDCFTWMVGGLFCCLCDKRVKRLKRGKGTHSQPTV